MFWILACDVPPGASSVEVESTPTEVSDFSSAARADLRMKRWRQLSLDLQGALELPADEVCRETGLYDCFDIHTVPMGGLSRDNGLYHPTQGITVTTGLAMERVVLQACWNRLELDREGHPVVFTVDLEGDSDEGLDDQVDDLYHRLLARNPEEAERALLVDFHDEVLDEGGGTAEWALMSCLIVGTTTEALLY